MVLGRSNRCLPVLLTQTMNLNKRIRYPRCIPWPWSCVYITDTTGVQCQRNKPGLSRSESVFQFIIIYDECILQLPNYVYMTHNDSNNNINKKDNYSRRIRCCFICIFLCTQIKHPTLSGTQDHVI